MLYVYVHEKGNKGTEKMSKVVGEDRKREGVRIEGEKAGTHGMCGPRNSLLLET